MIISKKCNNCEDGLVRYPGRIGVFACNCINRRCINCGYQESQADLACPPEDICPLNPGCDYDNE